MTAVFTPLDICNAPLLTVSPYVPGMSTAYLERELGIASAVKLSSNENLWGPSPKALEAIKNAAATVHFYPEGWKEELKERLSERHGVSAPHITLGNGSNELLDIVARCFLNAETTAVFSEHAFAIYPIVCQIAGAQVNVAAAQGSDDPTPYAHDVDTLVKSVDKNTRALFFANPNNPTGTYVSRSLLLDLLERVPGNVMVVVDQAYVEYADVQEDFPDAAELVGDYENLIVIQTFSKAFGLAGLRIGYALSSPSVANIFDRVRQPFNANQIAMAAACSALQDTEHLAKTVQENRSGLQQVAEACRVRSLPFIPSLANFLCIEFGSGAQEVCQELMERGVIVRPIANYDMPRHLRVTIGRPEDNARFIRAMDQALQS